MWFRAFTGTNELIKKLSNEFTNDECLQKYFYPFETNAYRVNNPSKPCSRFKALDNSAKIDVIKTWLQEVNFKIHDFLNRPVKRDQILAIFIDKLNNVNFNENKKNVRAKIVDILDELPINFYGTTRRTYLNRLANTLLNKLQRINFGVDSSHINRYKYFNLSQSGMTIFTSGIQPTEDELKVIVREELMEYIEGNKLQYNLDRINDVEADIIDILLDLMDDIKLDRDGNAMEEIICVLRETGMFTAEPEKLAKRILEQLKEMFNVVDESHITEKPQLKTESIIMYQNECRTKGDTLDSESQTSHEDDLKLYTLKISNVIDDWLNDLGVHKLKFYDKLSRQAIIDDLAEDVVDRFKYLELNPPKHYLFDDIEHLKFQIFKWMGKLTGESNLASIKTAPDLMRRIRKIPLPVLNSIDAQNVNENHEEETGTDDLLRLISDRNCSTESYRQTCRHCSSASETLCTDKPIIMNTPRRMSQLSMFASPKLSSEQNNVTTKESVAKETANYEDLASIYVSLKEQDYLQVPNALSCDPNASPCNVVSPSKSMKELNDEYDEFIKNWTYKIPIPSSTPEEQSLAEKLRVGIYNAVWKTVAKLKNHPSNIFNPFQYQDLLEDELEEIFQLLPQTEELLAKKHNLKVEFIEKTVSTNDQIKSSFAPDIFKQNLVNNILTHIPKTRTNIADENPVKLYEELEILKLAETYILFARFKDEDELLANVFRTKLVKRLQEIVNELKRTHQKELQDIDKDLYMNELLSAMQQVPLPSSDTIRAEAYEILLGMEIDHWMGYLPMVVIENSRELFTRKRLKDNLAKKIHDLQKTVNVSNIEGSQLLRMEISAFLDKLPLQKDESLNLNFMVEELTNRINNMNIYGTSSLNSTELDNLAYVDFSRQLQKASTFNQNYTSNVSSPNAQSCNERTILPGINAQLPSGQVPIAQCNANSSAKTISLWQSCSNGPVEAAGPAQGMQPLSNYPLTPRQVTSLGDCTDVQFGQPVPVQQQLQESSIPATADNPVLFRPISAAPVQNPLNYTSFKQHYRACSSFCPGQEIDQSNVGGISQSMAGGSNILGGLINASQSYHEQVNIADYNTIPTDSQQIGRPYSVRQAGVEQSRQADNQRVITCNSNQSCHQACPSQAVLPISSEPPNQLGPTFYRSTDPQGIKQFTEQNMKNRPQVNNQHISQQNVLSEFPASQGCSQSRPATSGQGFIGHVPYVSPSVCSVNCSASNNMNVQALPAKRNTTPPCPGKKCPALKKAMETQCPAKGCYFDRDDWEELNVRCKCIERFKRSRIRRLGYENPMYRPCFCFPDNI